MVFTLVIWASLHQGLGALMLGYCAARRAARRMTADYDADITNVSLYWHFVAFTSLVTTCVVVGFPRLV
jgi:cytochrome c oxidase subunit I+III